MKMVKVVPFQVIRLKINGGQIFGDCYYFDEDGYCLKGKHQIGATNYIFKDSGVMAVGWVLLDGIWRYCSW